MTAKPHSTASRKFARQFTKQLAQRFVQLPPRRLFFVGAVIATAVFLLVTVWLAFGNALFFSGFAADGAFQLFNPLRRLAAGQFAGSDFNFFHGVGVPLLHFPLFYLFGHNFFASELVRWLISPLVFALTTFAFFYAFRRRFISALVMTAGLLIVSLTIMSFFVLPGNSLLGVRAAMPVLVLAAMFYQEHLGRPLFAGGPAWSRIASRYELVLASLLAASLLCGTEFGLAMLIAFSSTHMAYPVRAELPMKYRVASLLRILGLFVIILLIALTLITRGNPIKPLLYAFVYLPGDQFWYFGVPPNTFLYLGNLLERLWITNELNFIWLFALMVAGLVWVVHSKKVGRLYVQVFVCALLAGTLSMISMLGYFNQSEAYALERMALLVAPASLLLLWDRWRHPLQLSLRAGRFAFSWSLNRNVAARSLGVAFVLVALVWSTFILAYAQHQYGGRHLARKAKNYVLGLDTNTLGEEWGDTDTGVIPVIQADNNVVIADVNDSSFTHGISTTSAQLIVKPGEHARFIHPGQIVYLISSGRQIIERVEPHDGGQLLVSLQNQQLRLKPPFEGAPQRLIIAEDFNHDNTKIWSLYSNLFEAEMGVFNNSHGYDYIIHALGPSQRAQYLQDFINTKPKFVVTLSRNYFIYEEWLQNAHWDLYSLIDQNYEVVAETSIHVVWKRKDQPWSSHDAHEGAWQKLDVQVGTGKVTLPKLSFDNVPDVSVFVRENNQAERARQAALGGNVSPDTGLDEQAYTQYKANQKLAELLHQEIDDENSGPVTEVLKKQVDDKILHQPNGPQPYLEPTRPKRQVVLVRLTYELSHPLGFIPLLGKDTRYFIELNNVYSKTPVSLRPYAHEVVFPVVVSEKAIDNAFLLPQIYSLLPGGRLHITSAAWAPLNTSVHTLKVLTDKMP
jgi:hypothetical protein